MRAGLWVGILCIVWGLLPLQTVVAQGNKKAKVKIVNADSLLVGTLGKPSRFIGNVHMTHENTLMWCDSLYQYELPDSNYLEAFGHVRVIKNDSIRMSGDYMYYDANKKLIQVRRNVTLEDPQMILTTDFLDYDAANRVGYYFNKGTIKDSINTLISDIGYYYLPINEMFFKDSVKVYTPEYTMYSDTLKYQTETVITILGPTNIYGDNRTLYSENGWYNSLTSHAELYKNNHLTYNEYLGRADTLIVDSLSGKAIMHQNIHLYDTVNNVIVEGNYGEVTKNNDYAYVTERAQLILVGKTDSLFVHGDTLSSSKDSLGNNVLKAYYNTKFFNPDLQGICDSMIFPVADSTVYLFGTPIVWASGNQLTGTTIDMHLKNNEVDLFHLNNKAFIVNQLDTAKFNQIKGRNMTGYIRHNELYLVEVDGNGESIYYPDDKGVIIGLNKTISSAIKIHLKEKRVNRIVFITKPEGTLNPLIIVDPKDRFLKDFEWHQDKQPRSKEDIFNK